MLDSVFKRIPEYLIVSKNSLDRYYKDGISVDKKGGVNTIKYEELTIDLKRDSSDFKVFDQVLLEEGLSPVIKLIKERSISVETIVDCGANIGLTSLYLNSHLPAAKILALEPEPDNFRRLLKNIGQNKADNITPVQIGVWSKKAMLEHDINFCFAKGWAFSLRESNHDKGSIAVDTLANILVEHQIEKVDYLKMDIEGAEFELFRNLNTWKTVLDNAKIVTIEVHEKKGSIFEIASVLRSNGFEFDKYGELLTAWRP